MKNLRGPTPLLRVGQFVVEVKGADRYAFPEVPECAFSEYIPEDTDESFVLILGTDGFAEVADIVEQAVPEDLRCPRLINPGNFGWSHPAGQCQCEQCSG
ncbi:MAG: hypothetical protein BWY82_02943 [Verrucomicrobia bacterium ADurb.Bin474]|nr:MAG: hypothetical protein BWY82_02943 [Verrucomicrobia bacterium ADurb.Bin474]